jgi:transposase
MKVLTPKRVETSERIELGPAHDQPLLEGNSIMDLYNGIDIAMKTFVVFNLETGKQKIGNEATSIKPFLRSLPEGAILAIESTGGYGDLLAEMAVKAGFTVYMLRPDKVKKFREAGPYRSKTDDIDAKVIRDYLETYIKKLHPYQPLPALEAQIRRFSRTRDKLVQKMSDMRKALRSLGDSTKDIDATLAPLAARINRIEKQLAELIEQTGDGKVLFSIPSIKLIVTAAVLPAIRTIRFKSKHALVSFFGMDLKADESGEKVGRRRMSKQGDGRARKALYIAAVSASHSKAFGSYYQMLRQQKRLTTTQALNALARKLLHIIYGVYYSQTPFRAPT